MFAFPLAARLMASEATFKQTEEAGREPTVVGNTRELAYDSKGSITGGVARACCVVLLAREVETVDSISLMCPVCSVLLAFPDKIKGVQPALL